MDFCGVPMMNNGDIAKLPLGSGFRFEFWYFLHKHRKIIMIRKHILLVDVNLYIYHFIYDDIHYIFNCPHLGIFPQLQNPPCQPHLPLQFSNDTILGSHFLLQDHASPPRKNPAVKKVGPSFPCGLKWYNTKSKNLCIFSFLSFNWVEMCGTCLSLVL